MSGGIPSWAVPGRRVVCVDASGFPELREDAVYTINGVGWAFRAQIPDGSIRDTAIAVDLVEVKNPDDRLPGHGAPGFHVSRFRPAVEPGADEEIEARLYRSKSRHTPAPKQRERA